MPYGPVKAFWVEPTGKFRAHVKLKGEAEPKNLGDFDSEALAELATQPYWDRDEADHSGRAPLYRLPDGTLKVSNELPPGALYDASYLHDIYPMPDGICLVGVCPNGHHWIVDSRASNCTMPDDNVHRCWIRHGDPRTGPVHVDKEGHSCKAGAGSIMCGGDPGSEKHYHGHLHNGEFTAG